MNIQLEIESIKQKIRPWSLNILIVFNVLITLFFIQALRAYIPPVYVAITHVVFGEDVITNLMMILTMLLLLLPLITKLLTKIIRIDRLMKLSSILITLLRLLISIKFSPVLLAVFSGLTIAFYAIYVISFIITWNDTKEGIKSSQKGILWGFVFSLAFLIDYTIRTIGLSQDISLLPIPIDAELWYIYQYLWVFIQVPLTLIIIIFLMRYFPEVPLEEPKKEKLQSLKRFNSWKFVGIGMFLFIQFTLFLYPNAIAQHTNTSYPINNILSISGIMITIILILTIKQEILSNKILLLGLNGIVIISFILFFYLGDSLSYISSILIVISLIVMYIDIYLIFSGLFGEKYNLDSIKSISAIITINLVLYLIFTVFHVMTTEWAETLEALKGFGPPLMIVAACILTISTILVSITNQKESDI